MKNTLSSIRNPFSALILNKKLYLLIFTAFFCFSNDVYAAIKATNKYNNKKYTAIKMKRPGPTSPAISYSSPQTYLAGTAITALAPASSAVDAPGYNDGTTTLSTGFTKLTDIAVDAAGNVYVADEGTNVIIKIPAAGGIPVNLGSGFSSPAGVAVDAAGNIYVADAGNHAVKKIPVGGGAILELENEFFTDPTGIAVDAAGNVYVADPGNNSVKVISKEGTVANLGSGYNNPTGIAVDAAGNVYVADEGNNEVKEINPAGTSTVVLGSGFNLPYSVAVDAAGNVFVSDQGNTSIKEIPVGGGSPIVIGGTGFSSPYGVAADGKGNIYVANRSNNTVKVISPVGGYYIGPFLPMGLTFDNTTGVISGTPTLAGAATNYTVTAYNSSGSSSAMVSIKVNALTISYASPQIYTAGTAITPLVPTSSGVVAPRYGNSAISLTPGYNYVFNQPFGVAVDAAGNVYVSDSDFGSSSVKKIPAGGGEPVIIGTGFENPNGIALDAAGNVYVCDAGNRAVKKIPVGGGSPVTIASSFTPAGIAVDASGNVYVSDPDNDVVNEIPAGGGAIHVIASGFFDPQGLAVDAAGNIYVAEFENNAVKKIPAGGGTPIAVGSGFSNPSGVAVDAAGNIFVADYGNFAVQEIPANGSSQVNLAAFGGDRTFGIAVDGAGNLYTANQNNNPVYELKPAGGYHIGPSLPAGLNFNTNTGVISGTPRAASPATNYTVTAYNSFGGNSAIINIKVNLPPAPAISYSSPQTYYPGIAITALKPVNSGGTVTAPGFSSNPITVVPAVNSPYGVVVDAAGNVYVSDYLDNAVYKFPPGGGSQVPVGSGFSGPAGLAIDAAGNIYVADAGNNAIKKIPAGGGTPVILGSGFGTPYGVAVDAAGNVYVGDTGNNMVKEIPVGGGAPVVVGSGFNSPAGVAVDAAGNVYVADEGSNTAKEIPVGGGPTVPIGSGFNGPFDVTVDVFGNVYVADVNNNAVKMLPVGGGATVSLGNGFNGPGGLALDAGGNLLVTDLGSSSVKEIKPAGGYYISPVLPAGLSLSSTTGIISGTSILKSPATNYKVTAYNLGGSSSATVNIQVTPNTNLSALKISNGTLSPVFAEGTTSYAVTVGSTITSVKIKPTTDDPQATVKVNGTTVTSGTASADISLSVGANIISTIVTARDGVTTKTYTVTVNRVAANDADLSAIAMSNGTLAPVFAAATTSYTDNVSNAITSVTVKPHTSTTFATVTVNGTSVASGTASGSIMLNPGPNAIVLIVTAQDGTTTKTYTLNVIRAPSSNAALADLVISSGTLTPSFATGTLSYKDNISNATASVTIRPTVSDATATVTVNGTTVASGTLSPAISLSVGPNTVSTVVTAQDGVTTKTYTIIVNRTNAQTITFSPSANATYGDADFSPGAVSTNNTIIPITYASSNTAVATITTTGKIHIISAGNTNITASQAGNVNYDPATPAVQVLTVNPVTLTITAARKTRKYGAVNPNLTVSYQGFVNGDTQADLATLPIASTTATPTSIVGNYPVTVSGAAASNYTFTYVAGTLTVSPAELKITAADKTKVAGAANPKLTVSYQGFVNGDTQADLTTLPTISTTATTSSPAGDYPITASGAAAVNYTFTYVDGTMTVNAGPGNVPAQNADEVLVNSSEAVTPEVKSSLSPNGDGINDVLTIANIAKYPDNKLMIINAAGAKVFEVSGYNNVTHAFDGHSNITGAMQQPGTYFYLLEYKANGENKRKTGYIILKY